jgi:amino acid adenylation domain-containing protein/non-ribosomal peptide synthase protein (TIGR01720 family)
VALIEWAKTVFSPPQTAHVLFSTSIGFDLSVFEIFLPLSSGGALVVAQSALDLPRLPSASLVTLVNTVPTAMAELLRLGAVPPSVRTICLAGEPLTEALAEQIHRETAVERLYNLYGPTEDTTYSTFAAVPRGGGAPTIGRPIANGQAYVLDAALSPVPVGVAGEIYLGGAGLARGYLHRPELTAERFIPSPFGGASGKRLYRTGDLGRHREDGALEYLGRIDHQVKLRGYRIELGDIEAQLGQHPAVRESVVLLREDTPGERRLVAYVVPRAQAPTTEDLRAFLRERLPEFMVPAAVVFLERLPLGAHGKIDRRALPAPGPSAAPRLHVAPRDPVEEAIATIFADVLDRPGQPIGAHDSFFELGGHSLLGTRLLSRLRAALAVDLPLRALFEARTPAELGARVHAALASGASTPLLPFERRTDERAPLSFGQERLWFLDQLDPGDPSYLVPLSFRLRGPLDAAALERALGEIVRRHHIFRTHHRLIDDHPTALVGEPSFSLPREQSTAPDREEAAREAMSAEARAPFDLATSPPLRARLLTLGEADHLLLLTLHHIAADAWTVGVVHRELGALYTAFRQGHPSPLAELPLQYADYARWQRARLGGPLGEAQLAYWREQLAGAPFTLDLPADRPRPAVQSHRGVQRRVSLPASVRDALQALSRREGVTLFMTLLAALDLLLHRYTGRDDLLVGSPIANRTAAEVEGLCGFFVNTLVLRTRLSTELGFQGLLARVKETCLGAYAHQDLPFERLVSELDPERDLARSPLFQVAFNLQTAPQPPLALAGLDVDPLSSESGTSKFDLSLWLADGEGGLEGFLEYATDLFDASTIERLWAHYCTLLEAVCHDPSARLRDLPLLPAEESERLIVTWNRTERPYPRREGLAQLFAVQVEQRPQAIALAVDGEQLDYRTLNERANRLAHHLLSLGVPPGALIGLSLPRGAELVIGMLAILKAGGAYVPLDPEYPRERLAFMIEDARLPLIIAPDDLAATLPESAARFVRLGAESAAIAAQSSADPPPRSSGADLAYVIYTSGSTGTPKGVLVTQRAVSRLVLNTDYVQLGLGDRIAQASNASFDAATFEIWGALLNGACVVSVPKDIALSPHRFAELLRAERITTLFLTTALFQGIIRELPSAFQTLHTVLFGGEAVDPGAVREALRQGPRRLLHVYGPTETTTFATWYPVSEVPEGAVTVPIGGPIANTHLYVLDTQQKLCPIGVPGELCIGGDGVALGYLRRPELSAERFIPDPFAMQRGGAAASTLYRSGDLVRRSADGSLSFLGRLDQQVKIRGYRVELGEIEAALLTHPLVDDAVVLLREDSPGDKRLVAYVTGAGGASPAAADLRRVLEAKLPAYMVPSAFVLLLALPLTANGKIDRRALPAPEPRALAEGAHIAPRGPIEEALVAIFAEVLRASPVGAHDDFFALGGHSLLGTQVIARVRSTLGVDLPLRALFEAPSPAALAARVAAALGAGEGAFEPLTRAPAEAEPEASFAQERLWLIDQLSPGDPSYLVPLARRLRGPLDVPALRRALEEIVERHEVLRTTFSAQQGRPIPVVHAGSTLPFAHVHAAGEAEQAAREELAAEARRPFGLSRDLPLRARLVSLGVDDHVLLLTLHHIVADAWSLGVLDRELAALYQAFSAGAPSPLPALTLQYGDYARWQRRRLSGPGLERPLAYWRSQLEGAPFSLDLPLDRPRPPAQSHRGARRALALDEALARSLAELSRKEGVTLFMTLLAALDVLLHRHTGQSDLLVGVSTGNRTAAESEQLIGFFVNALVLRARVAGEQPFRALLAQVKETCLGAYAHEEMPFERLVMELSPGHDLARSPLFQVMLTMQGAASNPLSLPGLEVTAPAAESSTAKFDLTFMVSDAPQGKLVTIEYATDLFEAATIERMLARFVRLLQGIVAAPEATIASLPLLDEEERQTLLVGWNATTPSFSADIPLHALFEAQVDHQPDRLALVAPDGLLTYRELESRANGLARELRRLGVGRDAVVGLHLGRSVDFIVALLAVLKAGGAYLPLDPTHPGARLRQLVTDAQATVVISAEPDLDWLGAGVAQVVLRGLRDPLENHQNPRLEGGAAPGDLAYLLFTSGSTGRPKAVAIEHRSIVNYLLGVRERLALSEGWRYAHVSTFSADLGNTVLFPPLCLGGTLHILSDEQSRDPEAFGATLAAHDIDCLKIVPSHLSALLSGPHPERALPRALLILGGEASSWELIERIHALSPTLRVVNHYGPTETTVGVLTHAVPRGHRAPGAPTVPLGRPLPGSRVYLLDASMSLVPPGVPGELCIAGAGVARGYLHDEARSAERFVPDLFATEPGQRLYRSGDRARHLADGTLVFLGRLDHQVKIRGHRVELGEIEAALAAHPALREAVVVARETSAGDRRLIAYVVPAADPSPDGADLQAYLESRLPGPMIPAAFVQLEALPLNANGKIDRAALPDPTASATTVDDAPRNPIEELLASIWLDVFGKGPIGVHERFGDLGGHSLLAIQIIARAREAFQCALPLRAIFESPTIAELGAEISTLLEQGEGLTLPPILPASGAEEPVLSFAQERLWFLTQLEPDSPFYNVPLSLRLEGQLDTAALEKALGALVERHEVLRTTVATLDGRPAPRLRASAPLRLRTDDLRAVPEGEREAAAERLAQDEAVLPFDLAEGPLLRLRLLRLSDSDHRLILVLHHIVSDAWTRDVLYRELAELYQASHEARPPRLAPLPIQHADFARWQRRWMSGDTVDRHLAYWRSALEGAPRTLDLATDRPRPRVQSHRGARCSLALPDALRDALKELSRKQGVTLFMTLFSAFAVLLHRYTAQDDLLIGSPAASRSRRETESLIGFFVNTLVLRARPTAALPFEALLAQVRETCLGAYTHEDLPFERLVMELSPERDLTRSPLFQVMFTLHGGARPALDLPGLSIRESVLDSATAKFDLTLVMSDEPAGLTALIEYDRDLFEPATIEHMLAHLAVLLQGVVDAPAAPIGDLPLLGPVERAELVPPELPWPAREEPLIHERFEAQADRRPEAVALRFEGQALSYGELERRSNRLAHQLRSLGVGPERLVGLCVSRSPQMLIGILAILKAGGAYLPLDPDYPPERLRFMVEDAQAPVVVTEQAHLGLLPAEGRALLCLDRDAALIAASPDTRPPRAATPENLAYVIYTSGSTGTPKGALLQHANVSRLFSATDPWFHFDERDVWTLFHSFAFDFSVWEMWGALAFGGCLIVVPYWVSRSPEAFHDLLLSERVTVLNQTPSAFRQLVGVEEVAARKLSSLRYVIFGGEALDLADLRPFWALHGDERPALINMYGITETTVHVTYRPLGLADLQRPWASVIGVPIPDLRVHILDADRRLLPIGVPGEMYVGGAGVARGYLNRAELSAERFLPDPFSSDPAARLYRTGDRARRLRSGDLEYLGRVDQQVKIRGHRIEPGEIEAVLVGHPAVRAAVVLARDDGPGERRLVAYLVAAPGEAPSVAELRSFARQKLPDPMIPAAFVLLDQLPLTVNGKIDRRALPAPEEAERPALAGSFAAPRGHIEEELCRIWAAVLRVESVGIHDNFFERGGDSISSIQIVARAQKAGLRLSPRQIFEHQTVAEQALVAVPSGALVAEQGPVTGPVALLPIQRWWLAGDPIDAHHFNQALLLDARDPLDPALLAQALTALVAHHDMLRVRLVRDTNLWAQTIAAPGEPAALTLLDLSTLPASEQLAALEAEAARLQQSLDLARGPTFRALLVTQGPAEPSRLLLVAHHLAVDGVSWRFLLEDLWTAYAALRDGLAASLPPKTTSFQRWAERLVEHAGSPQLAAQAAYWRSAFPQKVRPLPRDLQAGDDDERSAASIVVTLDESATEALLREVPEAYHTQINDVLLTAFARTIARFTASSVVLVDLEGHGREEILPDLDPSRTAGWFTSLFPVALTLDPDAPLGAVLTSIKEQLRAVPDRGLGYGLLRYLSGDERMQAELAALPTPEIAWNYLGQLDQALPAGAPLRWASAPIGPAKSPRQLRRHPLEVNAHVLEGCLRARFTYGAGRFLRTTIASLAEGFVAELRALIAHCRSPEAGGYSPSDFRKVSLDQHELDDLLGDLDTEEQG